MSKLDTLQLQQLYRGQSKFINNIFQRALQSVSKTPPPVIGLTEINSKSEDPYLPYNGAYIRRIFVETFNFDRSFNDTTQRDRSFGARVGKALHAVTRPSVVRDNLFVKQGKPLNAYMLADNERYLRTLPFIQDARIVVKPLLHCTDSVDLVIYTKDLLSIAGGAASQGTNLVTGNIYETNLGGRAQRLELMGLYNRGRTPTTDYGALYRKNNILGSFIEGTALYNRININRFTNQEEHVEQLNLYRPLISPYSSMAGSMSFSNNRAYNVYNLAGRNFFNYKYENFDVWAGYNVAISKLTATNNSIRDRRFFALRYYNKVFDVRPQQVANRFDPFYNKTRYLLGQLTFFRQDYFKTQYIYGFGTTEDLPYGYNVSITAGWHRQEAMERPYAGIKTTYYLRTKPGDFFKLYLKAGGFLRNNLVQDGSLLVGATAYSRLLNWGTTQVRPFVNASYTKLTNRVVYEPLALNNFYGIRGFLSDSIYGTQRCSVQLEAAFYIKRKLFGFKFAPFPYADFAVITPENAPFAKSLLYTSVGGGLRARNESLVFETIEIRAYYFPVTPANTRDFKVILSTNLRFRYTSNYVTAPDLVQLNDEN
jgi:hypothetical protein